MISDSTSLEYWLNWRFFLCALWIIIAIVISGVLIFKYEGPKREKSRRRDDQLETVGVLYQDETWRTCLKVVHPAWLLVYRLIAFSTLLALLTADLVVVGVHVFYFYTQWTFALVTLYFGLGSLFSAYGCCQYCKEDGDDRVHCGGIDSERGAYMAPSLQENLDPHTVPINLNNHQEPHDRKIANLWGYSFQIIFQICGGAVALTDIVFWFVIYPFLTPKGFRLSFLEVSMHSVNAIFFLIDLILNNMRFPFFRMAYFALWTVLFVIFQWIIHACVSMWWPYPFLDLASPYAPLWYLGVGLLIVPCYSFFAAIARIKQFCLSTYFDPKRPIRT